MNKIQTYFGETNVRFADPKRESGSLGTIPVPVLRALNIKPGEGTIIWRVDANGQVIAGKKKQ